MKTVLFVPGFQEDIHSRDYETVLEAIAEKRYLVRFVPIDWKRTTINDWTNELDRTYHHYDPKDVILAGFSYGAMTAFVVASQRTPSALWCFSLSPYFAEDLRSMRMKLSWLKAIGLRRTKAFAELEFSNLAQRIHCETLLFVGSNEQPIVKERAYASHHQVRNSHLMVIPGGGHDVGDAAYIAGIRGAGAIGNN
jgi:pimeloyl-ACP methyl ester carboxylesterase